MVYSASQQSSGASVPVEASSSSSVAQTSELPYPRTQPQGAASVTNLVGVASLERAQVDEQSTSLGASSDPGGMVFERFMQYIAEGIRARSQPQYPQYPHHDSLPPGYDEC